MYEVFSDLFSKTRVTSEVVCKHGNFLITKSSSRKVTGDCNVKQILALFLHHKKKVPHVRDLLATCS